MREKRFFKRLSCDLPAAYRVTGSQDEYADAKIINIGAIGMSVAIDKKLEVGEEIDLKISLEGDIDIFLECVIIWANEIEGSKQYQVGVKVVEASAYDEEQLMRFYFKLMLKLSKKDKKKILVVEDEEDILRVLKFELEHNDYEVVYAVDGEEAYSKYLTEQPDLIILDVMIPKLNGFEVCRRIRRENKDERTPILMLTGKTEDADRIVGKVIGAEKYITKPFDKEVLLNSIKDLLAR